MKRSIVLLILSAAWALAASELSAPIATKGKLLFADDFDRSELGENWKSIIPAFKLENGALVGTQASDAHGAVGRVYVPMKDLVFSFRFKLVGTPRFNVVFDDKNHKDSHAGHIARVAVNATKISLGDDKEGVMRNDIFALRRDPDPARKAEANRLAANRSAAFNQTIEQERWYAMTIEIAGKQMRVSLDGKPVGLLESPGLAHPTKESVHFTVTGSDAHFDMVRIWNAK